MLRSLLILAVALVALIAPTTASAQLQARVTVKVQGHGEARTLDGHGCPTPATTPAQVEVTCGSYAADRCETNEDVQVCTSVVTAVSPSSRWVFAGWTVTAGGKPADGCPDSSTTCTVLVSTRTCVDFRCETTPERPVVVARFKDLHAPVVGFPGADRDLHVDANGVRTLSWTTDEPEEQPTFACALDGAPLACGNPNGMTLSNLADGVHTFAVTARDPSGNESTTTRTWDQERPLQVDLLSGPPDPVESRAATFQFGTNKARGVSYSCELDGATARACSTPVTYGRLAVGRHTLKIVATFAPELGSSMTAQRVRTWEVVDTTPPELRFTQSPPDLVVDDSRTQTFRILEPDELRTTYECRLDGAPPSACDAVAGVTVTGLSDGIHRFTIKATDDAGNTSESSIGWEQQTRPQVLLDAGLSDNAWSSARTLQFAFGADRSGAITYQCRFDAAPDSPWAGCSSPHDVSGLADGRHTFEVRALLQDRRGGLHPGPGVIRTWITDTVGPDTQIVSGPGEGGLTSDTSAQFGFSSEPDARFECSLDDGPFAPCPASARFAGIAPGSHRLAVRAVDAAGNGDPTPAVRTWRTTNDFDQDGALAGSGPGFDCDDRNPAVRPGAVDIPRNRVDEDCDGIDDDWPKALTPVSMRVEWRGKRSRVLALELGDVTTAARVTVTCKARGRGCPFTTKTVAPRRAGKLVLTKLFKRRWLPAGVRIVVTVRRPDAITPSVTYVTRLKQVPKRTDRCVAPDRPAPGAC